MRKDNLITMARNYFRDGKRVVAPLMGFPGLTLVGCSVKLGQQNHKVHYSAIKSLVDEFHPDVIFPLMDLSVEANAIGSYTIFPPEEAPTVIQVGSQLASGTWFSQIDIAADARAMSYFRTLRLMVQGLPDNIKKGAYITGPYTLAALVLGASAAAAATLDSPKQLHDMVKYCSDLSLDYSRLCISAGVDVICILEPSGSMLGPDQFETFSCDYVKNLVKVCVQNDVDCIYHVCGNSMHLIEKMVKSGIQALSLDSDAAGVSLCRVAQMIPENVVVIGNVNPTGALLIGTPQDVQLEVTGLLESMRKYPNFILSTACDMPKDTPIDNIKAFMEAGRSYTASI